MKKKISFGKFLAYQIRPYLDGLNPTQSLKAKKKKKRFILRFAKKKIKRFFRLNFAKNTKNTPKNLEMQSMLKTIFHQLKSTKLKQNDALDKNNKPRMA
jgi:site-specific recombinase XerD